MTPEDAIVATADRIAELLEAGADPHTPLPGAEWTVGEAAAHLALAGKLMADIGAGEDRPYGDGTPSGLAAANRASLDLFPQRDPAVLGAEIAVTARAFVAAAAGRDPREAVLTPMGPMDLSTLSSYLLTHLLGHGYDIAVALRGPHMVDRDMVALTLPFMRQAMPRVVNADAVGHHACYLLRIGSARFAVTFADGVPTVTDTPPRRPDCTIAIDPVAFLLLALGRWTAPTAMARAKVVAWGRKPWLGLRFPLLFTAP
ncbi:maleylpyruvate isomerase family mycothiol-dependent enzyme [Streptomyces griseorubiginosus]|uniref:maleylpyruvate isomerase family mycothiol-dependent enzyme n=1 Tax=Streptomyces griseorubiginosus TaxID=67304 RepID=UPI002E80016D|nr:maleylpyruvate isomerase family mycothiol-dependent enzyme [Streptomyces griseorubiginosus]WUB42696.1 maleylpyruvate isomerase family mycothiol-dependent enzyme [Streptomyces griseorubiginosus]WUB51215.1 maleylpyruvate isomerase family mycothiol-dependent enzyme [Streptomyces griseorubiginosus]